MGGVKIVKTRSDAMFEVQVNDVVNGEAVVTKVRTQSVITDKGIYHSVKKEGREVIESLARRGDVYYTRISNGQWNAKFGKGKKGNER